MSAFLNFAYTDCVLEDLGSKTLGELMVMADLYDVIKLKMVCEQRLVLNLELSNCTT